MSEKDGHNVVGDGPDEASKWLVSCSRWAELTTSLRFHASLADATCSPTEFRLLNQGNPVLLGTGRHGESVNQSKFASLLSGNPSNGTPLCRHIREIVREIQRLEPSLRAQGQRALLVIATDGEASDGDVAEALRPLKDLPVWVIVRLCTDRSSVVSYWNNIDSEIELNMDVLDDLCGEAKEIYKLNKWLTYGEPLQRLREFGCSVKEFDLLDERKLSIGEITKVCALIFGGSPDRFPYPHTNWKDFIAAIAAENAKIPAVWNPVTKTVRPWIDTDALTATYSALYHQKSAACTIC